MESNYLQQYNLMSFVAVFMFLTHATSILKLTIDSHNLLIKYWKPPNTTENSKSRHTERLRQLRFISAIGNTFRFELEYDFEIIYFEYSLIN